MGKGRMNEIGAERSRAERISVWDAASISCRVNFNLQLFCDRRFCQHASPKLFRILFLFSVFSFFFFFSRLICFSFCFPVRIYMTFGLFGQFGMLAKKKTYIYAYICILLPFAAGPHLPLVRIAVWGCGPAWAVGCTKGAAGLIAAGKSLNYASLAPAENSISQMRQRREKKGKRVEKVVRVGKTCGA